jgi:uncharacterized RmlC-like cupin family protein
MKFCPTCLDFSNRFAGKIEELLVATSNMAGVAGVVGRRDAFQAARLEVQRLRTECKILKAEMKRHKSEHRDGNDTGDTSQCVAAIIAIVWSEFQANAVVDRSSSRPNVTFSVSGQQFRIYIGDHFEDQYAAAPQTGDLILAGLPEKLRASSTGTRAVLVSRSGITILPKDSIDSKTSL